MDSEKPEPTHPQPLDYPAKGTLPKRSFFSFGMPSLGIAIVALLFLLIGWAAHSQNAIATAGALSGIAGIAAFACGFITGRLDAWAWNGLALSILVLMAIPLAVR